MTNITIFHVINKQPPWRHCWQIEWLTDWLNVCRLNDEKRQFLKRTMAKWREPENFSHCIPIPKIHRLFKTFASGIIYCHVDLGMLDSISSPLEMLLITRDDVNFIQMFSILCHKLVEFTIWWRLSHAVTWLTSNKIKFVNKLCYHFKILLYYYYDIPVDIYISSNIYQHIYIKYILWTFHNYNIYFLAMTHGQNIQYFRIK